MTSKSTSKKKTATEVTSILTRAHGGGPGPAVGPRAVGRVVVLGGVGGRGVVDAAHLEDVARPLFHALRRDKKYILESPGSVKKLTKKFCALFYKADVMNRA